MTNQDSSESVEWSEVIDWECDTDPDSPTRAKPTVTYTRTLSSDSFCESADLDTTVVIRVYDNGRVAVFEVMDDIATPVVRISHSGLEDVVHTIQSIATVYEDGRDAVRQWIYNRIEERTDRLSTTFSAVDEISIDSSYELTFIVTDEIDETSRTILSSYSREPVLVPDMVDGEPVIRIEGRAPISL